MMNDELTGTFVLVAPERLVDHYSNQDKIGIITSSCVDDDGCVFVSFGTGYETKYSPRDLMVLKKPSVIYSDMMRNATKMETSDFKELFRISLLLDSGLHKDTRRAINIAKCNSAVLTYSMTALTTTLGRRSLLSVELYEAV